MVELRFKPRHLTPNLMLLNLEYSNITSGASDMEFISPYHQAGQEAVGLNERRLVNHEN